MERSRSIAWLLTLALGLLPIVAYATGFLIFRAVHTRHWPGPTCTVVYHNETVDRYLFFFFIPAIMVDKAITGRVSHIQIASYFYEWSNDGP